MRLASRRMSATGPEPQPSARDHPLSPIRPEGTFGGAELLLSDVRVLSRFADEARRRTLLRLFGIPKTDPSALVTLIALATAADAIRRGLGGVPGPSRPSATGWVTGVAVVKEVGYRVAGPWARESPFFGTLLAYALMGTAARFALRKSLHGVKSASHEARREFDHRYGHLIRPNRSRRQVVK